MAQDPQPDRLASAAPLPPRRRDRPWLRRLLLFVACIVAADALVGERGLAQTLKARRDLSRSTVELSAIRAENATLREDIRRLKEDRSTLEHVARGELGLVRRGEILVIVKDVPAAR